jgi:hypothetical protein
MTSILNNILSDQNFAWTNTLESKPDFFSQTLSKPTIDEIFSNKNKLKTCNSENFILLKNEITTCKKKFLVDGCGFMVIDGSSFSTLDNEEKKYLHLLISSIIGKLLEQNKNHELLVEIKDMGKSMKDGARYHHTKEGGSYHTDGFHIFKDPPEYIGLLCINPAKSGGLNRFASAYTIHNKMLERNKELLQLLYENFYMDKRGEENIDESPTQFEPIFSFIDNMLKFRYQREYIEHGHIKQNSPLNQLQIDAFDLLDKIMREDSCNVNYMLKSGDMLFSNNIRLIHDRTTFIDFDEANLKRTLVRCWIRENGT